MVVIEHDMPLIMGICDRVYCLEAAGHRRGDPDEVRDDPRSWRPTSAPTSGRSRGRGGRRAAPPSGFTTVEEARP